MLLWFIAIKEPQLTGHGTGVEEVGTDGDHQINVAGLDQFLPHLGLAATGTGGLGRHHKTGPAILVQVAVEIADPDVVAVTDLFLFIDAGQTEG